MNLIYDSFSHLLLSFIPIFIAIDAVGILPLLIGLTDSLSEAERRRVISHSVLTAGIVGVGFLFLGKLVLWIIGVTVNDFRVAGGIILLVLAIMDLVTQEKTRRLPGAEAGVFPIGTPLIAGPAVLTALLTLSDLYNPFVTLVAFLVNLLLVYIAFLYAARVVHFLGSGGVKAAAKLASLLLAAYAVMLIRGGVEQFVQSLRE